MRHRRHDLGVGLALDVWIEIAIGGQPACRRPGTNLEVLSNTVIIRWQNDARARRTRCVQRTIPPIAVLVQRARRVRIRKASGQRLVVLAPTELDGGLAVAE